MSGKHTPGPWQVVPAAQAQSRWIVGDAEGGSIADCEPCGPWMTGKEADANARLIATAPDLLEALRYAETGLAFANTQALEKLKERNEYESIFQAPLDAARAAIAKATGKEL